VPTASEVRFTTDGGAFQPVVDLNHTLVAGDTSSGHSKTPRAHAAEDLPDAVDLFGQMPTQPMFDEVPPGLLLWSIGFI
jgi:hypothetical protein